MSRLRRLLEIFLALSVLTLTVPSLNWQDNGDDNDAPQSSDNSGDQPVDQAASLVDFLLEESVVACSPVEHEIISALPENASEKSFTVPRSHSVPFPPLLFISESGLMPRAPSPA